MIGDESSSRQGPSIHETPPTCVSPYLLRHMPKLHSHVIFPVFLLQTKLGKPRRVIAPSRGAHAERAEPVGPFGRRSLFTGRSGSPTPKSKSRPIKADYFRRLARVWHMQFRFAGSGSSLQRQLQQRLGRELCGRPLISSVHKMSASSNWPFQLLFHSADVFTLVLTVSMLTTSRRPQAPQFWGNRVETDCQFIS